MPGTLRDRRLGIGRLSADLLHPDTRNYRDRIIANGGQISDDPLAINAISNADLRAIDTFVRSAYSNNYRQYYLDYCPLAGTGLLTAQVKLWYPAGVSSTLTLVNFVAGDYSRTTGLTSNASGKYANTHLRPLTQGLNANNVHLSVYSRTDLSGGTTVDIGARGPGSTTESLILAAKLSGNTVFDSYDATTGRVSGNIASLTSLGLFLGNRVSSTDSRAYRRETEVGSVATVSGTCPDRDIYLYAFNNNGTPVNYALRSLGDYSIGLGIPLSLISRVNSDRQALMTAFGRAV